MLKAEYQGQFKKDYKLAVIRGCNPEPFWFRALLLFLLCLKHSLRASAADSCFLHNMYIQ